MATVIPTAKIIEKCKYYDGLLCWKNDRAEECPSRGVSGDCQEYGKGTE